MCEQSSVVGRSVPARVLGTGHSQPRTWDAEAGGAGVQASPEKATGVLVCRPAPKRWSQEGRKFRVIFNCIEGSRSDFAI